MQVLLRKRENLNAGKVLRTYKLKLIHCILLNESSFYINKRIQEGHIWLLERFSSLAELVRSVDVSYSNGYADPIYLLKTYLLSS